MIIPFGIAAIFLALSLSACGKIPDSRNDNQIPLVLKTRIEAKDNDRIIFSVFFINNSDATVTLPVPSFGPASNIRLFHMDDSVGNWMPGNPLGSARIPSGVISIPSGAKHEVSINSDEVEFSIADSGLILVLYSDGKNQLMTLTGYSVSGHNKYSPLKLSVLWEKIDYEKQRIIDPGVMQDEGEVFEDP